MAYGPPPGYPPPGYGPPPPGYPPPGYGYPPQPPPKKATPTWVWVVAGVLGLFFVIGVAAGNKKKPSNSSASDVEVERSYDTPSRPAAAPQPAPPPPKPIDVTATQLFTEYEANEVAADQKYEGKLLRVKGTIGGVDKMFGDTIVKLTTSNQFLPVSAYGLSDDQAAKLQKGQAITLVCTGAGKVMTPTVRECSIE